LDPCRLHYMTETCTPLPKVKLNLVTSAGVTSAAVVDCWAGHIG